jgi:hypothetical protein
VRRNVNGSGRARSQPPPLIDTLKPSHCSRRPDTNIVVADGDLQKLVIGLSNKNPGVVFNPTVRRWASLILSLSPTVRLQLRLPSQLTPTRHVHPKTIAGQYGKREAPKIGLSAKSRCGSFDTLIERIEIRNVIQNNARGADCEGNA